MGCLEDIASQRGDYDEARRIRHEVELPACERLGDTRSLALTWAARGMGNVEVEGQGQVENICS
jgi:hypothetical protein